MLNQTTPYHNTIVEMIVKKLKIKEIYKHISTLGYNGKYGMVKHYVTKIKQEDKLEYNLTIKKIYNKINPKIKVLIEVMKEFKGILLYTRKEKALINWINKARLLNIDSINSFIKGLMNDYDRSNQIIKISNI